MSTVNLVSLEQNSQLLSTKTLPSDLTNLASAAVLTQANALVLMRQADATGLPDLNGLTTVMTHQQGVMRDHANYYLDRLLPDTIRVFSDASAAASLFTAARSVLLPMMDTLDSAPGARSQAEQMAETLASSLDNWLDNAKDAASELEREATQVERAQARLDAAVQATIQTLDGEDGQIAKTNASIVALRQSIEVNLQNVVMGGKDIGDGVKSLVTGVLTTIGLGKSETPPSGGAGKTDPKKPAPKADPKAKESGEEDGEAFPVESIDAVSDGVGKVSEAMQKFQADNAALAALYQKMAQLNSLLAVARAIGDQVHGYAASLRDAATTAGVVVRTISAVQSSVAQFANDIGDPNSMVTTLVAALNAGNSNWNRLNAAVLPIRQTLAGTGTLIPPRPASVVEMRTR